jgi:hypothetical protein
MSSYSSLAPPVSASSHNRLDFFGFHFQCRSQLQIERRGVCRIKGLQTVEHPFPVRLLGRIPRHDEGCFYAHTLDRSATIVWSDVYQQDPFTVLQQFELLEPCPNTIASEDVHFFHWDGPALLRGSDRTLDFEKNPYFRERVRGACLRSWRD